MKLSKLEKFEVLKLEMGLIQSTLDKYDDLIFRNRNWFITLWTGAVGLGYTSKSVILPALAIILAVVYWVIEGTMRHQYWYKYVLRYRTIRDTLNVPKRNEDISVYDLTDHYKKGRVSQWNRIRHSYLKVEPTTVYVLMGGAAFFLSELIGRRLI